MNAETLVSKTFHTGFPGTWPISDFGIWVPTPPIKTIQIIATIIISHQQEAEMAKLGILHMYR